jgi:hypothetical protein
MRRGDGRGLSHDAAPASLNPPSLNPPSLNPPSLNPPSLNPASLNPAYQKAMPPAWSDVFFLELR